MEYVMLKDICAITMGQSPDSNSYNDNGEGVPFFQGNADFGERYPVTRKWCSAPTKMAFPEDILISVRAPIGAMNYAKEECCIGRGLAALTPDNSKVSSEYIFWLLKGKSAELNSKGTGSTFKAIGRKVLEETKVPNIPLEKQIEYSEILDKIFAVIQGRKFEIQMLDELIKARFVEMFGDPVLNDKKFSTLSGEDFFKLSNGKAVPEEKRHEVGIPAYGGNGISWYTNEVLRVEDTLVVGRVGFQSGNVHYAVGPLWITDNAMYISQYDKGKINLVFLCELMQRVNFSRFQDAGDLKKITQKPFMSFQYILPSMELQQKFVDFKEQIDKSKAVIEKELKKTQLLFDSLMQKYFG